MLRENNRYNVETIQIYYRNERDMVMIGSFNDPHGPRRECGKPFVVNDILSPAEIGEALYEIYNACLRFSQNNLEKGLPPYVQAAGIKSWSRFAKGRKVIHIEWEKNGKISLERWDWLPSRGFGPTEDHPENRTVIRDENFITKLGLAVLEMIGEFSQDTTPR